MERKYFFFACHVLIQSFQSKCNYFILLMEANPRESQNKTEKSSDNTVLQGKENAIDYSQEGIIIGELPKPINGDLLKQLLHRSVGALRFLNKYKQPRAGSGVLISKDTVLTAAHNIYDRYEGQQNQDFRFQIGADGVAEEQYQFEDKCWKFPEQFKDPKSNKLEFDFAIMKLKKPIQFDQYLSLSLACQECLMRDNSDTILEVYGFPASYMDNYQPLNPHDKYGKAFKLNQYGLAEKNRIFQVDSFKHNICYSISTLPGHSGSPVVVNNKIIAVHIGDCSKFNVGRIVNVSFMKTLQKWREQLNAAPFNLNEQKVCQHVDRTLKNMKEKLIINQRSIKNIDLKEYVNLLELDLYDNKLGQIDVSFCQQLIKLSLRFNKLRKIDLTTNKRLTFLDLSANELQEIDIATNTNLTQLYLWNNQLQKIDLRANTSLQQLQIFNNQLQELDLSNNIDLAKIDLSSNKLDDLDVRANINLVQLKMPSNYLYQIDLSFNTKLIYLNMCCNFIGNNDRHLNLSANTQLKHLYLYNNHLHQIDLKANINLTHLSLSCNQLEELDLRNNTNLVRLELSQNKIKEIDTTINSKLAWMDVRQNMLSHVRLWIDENVDEDRYTGKDIPWFYFDFSNQNSTVCRVQLLCEGQIQNKQKAAKVAAKWSERYKYPQYNKRKCSYHFQVV